jgi:uncharacterized membrane protein
MSTMQVALKRSSWFRAKYLLFAVIGLMLAYVIPHDESFLVHPKDPQWQHYEPFKWWLLPHGIAGACALLLGPMQFSDRLRQRFSQFHRVVGRVYVAGVILAAPLGFYIEYFQERMEGARSFTIAAAVDAVLWMVTTVIAIVFILKGKVQEHQQWMTRSFAVALVFLEGRVIGGVTGWENLGDRASETIVWVCLAFSILSADLVLQWQKLARSPLVVRRNTSRSYLREPLGGVDSGPTADEPFSNYKIQNPAPKRVGNGDDGVTGENEHRKASQAHGGRSESQRITAHHPRTVLSEAPLTRAGEGQGRRQQPH